MITLKTGFEWNEIMLLILSLYTSQALLSRRGAEGLLSPHPEFSVNVHFFQVAF